MLFVKKINFHVLAFASICGLTLLACGQRREPRDNQKSEQNQVATQGSEAATAAEPSAKTDEKAIAKDEVASHVAAPEKRQFLRLADFRFRVKDVHSTEQKLEAITQKFSGFVTSSNLQTNTNETILAPYNSDSLLETTIYTVENTTTLRVPNQYFDTLLVQIDRMIEHLDYRKLTADDVSLQLLANKMRTQRGRELAGNLRRAIDKNGKKLGETIDGERGIAQTQNSADDAEITNMNLTDRVSFSTISLNIYQHEVVAKQVVANTNANQFHAGFFRSLADALSIGWYGLLDVVVVLAQAWTFWLVLAGVIWAVLRFRKR